MRLAISTLIIFSLFQIFNPCYCEIIDEIYAIVNDEIITHTELKNVEKQQINVLKSQLSGKELEKAILELKKNLLNRLIEQKLLLTKAKEKNYDVDNEVRAYIEEIKKQNNLDSDEALKRELEASGMNFNKWKEQIKEFRMQQLLVMETIDTKIKIGNPEIMEYYRNNINDYTIPTEISLNCIFIDKEKHSQSEYNNISMSINQELENADFTDVAEKYSELPNPENNYFLGKFKKGELNKKLEETALKLKKNATSEWIETENGWYILQLVEITEPKLMEYKKVRDEIRKKLFNIKRGGELNKYLQQLRKESYIKILKKYG